MQKILLRTVPATAPMVFPTFGKLSSVRTPSPPTEGPHEKGPAVKSMNAHLTGSIHKIMKTLCHLLPRIRWRSKPEIKG